MKLLEKERKEQGLKYLSIYSVPIYFYMFKTTGIDNQPSKVNWDFACWMLIRKIFFRQERKKNELIFSLVDEVKQ